MPVRVPVVISVGDVRRVLQELHGVIWVIASLLYDAGLRLQECLELRVKDVAFDRRETRVRRGKGQRGGRPDEAGDVLYVPAFVREASAGGRPRHSDRAAAAGPRRCEHDDLHACVEPGGLGVKSPMDRL